MRISDWSSDVCSSDLALVRVLAVAQVGDLDEAAVGLAREHAAGAVVAERGEIVADEGVVLRHAVERGHGQREARSCRQRARSEEHTSELQSLMRISYAVFCLKKKNNVTRRNVVP